MNLLERYLQAIGQYLPTSTREDVLNELRVNLLEQIEAREDELARPLSEPELSALLRGHGRPEVVATRYLPQRSLIGPTIFPSYLLTLRKALPIVLIIYVIAQGAAFIAVPHGQPLLSEYVRIMAQLIPTLFTFWSIVTIIFAIIEFAHTRPGFDPKWMPTSNWDPTKLPAVADTRQPKPKSFATRIADLAFHILWMLYILAIPRHPFLVIGYGTVYLDKLGISFAPIWHTFYLFLIASILIQLAIKLLALFSAMTRWLRPLDIASKVFVILPFGVVLSTGTYLVSRTPATEPFQLAVLNYGLGVSIRIALFFAVLDLLIHLWKYIRPRIHYTKLAF